MKSFRRSLWQMPLAGLGAAAVIAIGCGMPSGTALDGQSGSAAQAVAGLDLGEVGGGDPITDGEFAFAAAPENAGPGGDRRGGFGPRGPHHGEPGMGPGGFGPRLAERLGLTDEQRAQARAIFEAARTQADALRSTAVTDIRALLTSEQIATLDAALDRVRTRVEQAWAEGRPPHPGPGMRAHARRELLDDLALTDEQRTAIGDVRQTLRAALRTLRETTRTQFLALLTEEQKQQIQNWRENRPRRGPGGRPRAEMDGAPNDLPPDELDMIEHELALAGEQSPT